MKNENNLIANMQYLKLTYSLENYEQLNKHVITKQLTPMDLLESLMQGEANLKKDRATQRRIRNAKLPYSKILEQYKWSHPKKINRMQVENLFRMNFLKNKENVIFLGQCGLGKTHLSLALAQQACIKGYSTLFAGAIDIINNLTAAKAMNNLERALKKYTSPQLLVIDELGFLPIDKNGADMLFQVITKRYECGSIILTTNRAFKDWAQIFNNDSIVTSAILDRVLHRCEVVVIEGNSYRMNHK